MTSFELEARAHPDPGVRLVEVSGELDLTNAREVEARLHQLVQGAQIVVLDLNRVLFVDSAALHALFRLARRSGRLALVLEPGAAIARTLDIVGLSQVVPVAGTVDDVLAALASASV
jgi:anti-anti-sigma factor